MTTNLWATLSDLKIHVFIGCAGSLLLHGFFSGCSKRELLSSCSVQASLLLHCTDFSLWWLLLWSIGSRVLGLQWLQLKGSVVAVHSLCCMWGPPRPGVNPVSPGSTGGLFTSEVKVKSPGRVQLSATP